MQNKIKIFCLVVVLFIATVTGVSASTITNNTIGEYVRAADYIIYSDLMISDISADGIITAKLKVNEMLKGDLGKKETAITINTNDPNNYKKLKSDLNNLKVSAKEDIAASGSSTKQVIMMMRSEGDGYDFLRTIPIFRPDKLEIYLDSYREIVSMTKIADEKELLKTIKYNLGEEFTYSLYGHCTDELFKLDITFSELLSTVKQFLDFKGERKVYSWFMLLNKTGNRLKKSHDSVDEKVRDEFFSYMYESYVSVDEQNESVNKRFFDLFYDLRRLIIKNKKWQKKFHEALKSRDDDIDGLEPDHYRNQELKQKREKVMRSLSK